MTNHSDPNYGPIEVLPDPERVIEGLRDTGYQFNTAVADILDNSVAAGATNIDVVIQMDMAGAIFLGVIDNGCGMDKNDLINAMRYGSKKRVDQASLGKFGLGLKTASTAFCRRLSVISRNSTTAATHKAIWDLDHVAKTGKWQLLFESPTKDELDLLNKTAPNNSGTLILWEKTDRLLADYASASGRHKRNAFERYINSLKQHISTVYQRFLDPNDTRERTLTISVNGASISAWDPFCVVENPTPVLDKIQEIELSDNSKASFTVRAYVLPRKEEFNDQSLAAKAAISNDTQGIYIYRENRLIHGPDWLGMFKKEPHFSLLRVEFSFDHKLDEAFHIDIKKSQIILNESLYEWLREKFLPAPRREAELRYRRGAAAALSGAAALSHAMSNNAIHAKAEDLKSVKVEKIDKSSGEVTITNKHGKAKLKLVISEPKNPGELHVQDVDDIANGLLWEPALINSNQGVRINKGHPYYQKVYLPNKNSGVTIQGLDSLLWALCVAEMGTINDQTRKHFDELRFEVSRILRSLVDDMPEPTVDDTNP
jgi:hypothetical protein